ncbi:DUF397 domain-containing protein [Nocardia sp. NPDC003693]
MTHLSPIEWFKSSYSSSSGGECLEVAHVSGGGVAVRDSKLDKDSPVLTFEPAAWDAFTTSVRAGRFDRP